MCRKQTLNDAALGVMKGQIEKKRYANLIKKTWNDSFAHTQGHIPSGVPYIGHAIDAMASHNKQSNDYR